jgi:hypothetical protein
MIEVGDGSPAAPDPAPRVDVTGETLRLSLGGTTWSLAGTAPFDVSADRP